MLMQDENFVDVNREHLWLTKFLIKQKRNSCIAVMNDFSASNSSPMTTGAPTNINKQISLNSHTDMTPSIQNNSLNSNDTITSSIRDSVSSFQSYTNNVFSSTGESPGTSPIDRFVVRSNKNKFRQIANISSIFANYQNNQNRNSNEPSKLSEILNNYAKDLPKLPEELNVFVPDLDIIEIESDWNQFVGEAFSQSLPNKVVKQQMAIWELLTTECSHIKKTKKIIDVFLSCLISLKCSDQNEYFKDIDIKKLFCNIIEVFNCNLKFWQKYLHPILIKLSTSEEKLIDPADLVDCFAEFQTLFAPYEEFILEKNNSVDYYKQKLNENENFSKFILWAENHPLVGRLKLADFMMLPVQRLTKYQLLIDKIYQYTDDEAKREKIAVINKNVNDLPNQINEKLNYIAQFNYISESIEKYEGVIGPTEEITELLNSYKKLDLKSPLPGCSKTSVRELIHQGPLKLKELSKSYEVYCFLFTDMLLITQQKKSKKYKIIKPPVITSRMIVRDLSQTEKSFVIISLNDYEVPDSVSMFISNQSKRWIEFLELSKKKYLTEIEKCKNSAISASSITYQSKFISHLEKENTSETNTEKNTFEFISSNNSELVKINEEQITIERRSSSEAETIIETCAKDENGDLNENNDKFNQTEIRPNKSEPSNEDHLVKDIETTDVKLVDYTNKNDVDTSLTPQSSFTSNDSKVSSRSSNNPSVVQQRQAAKKYLKNGYNSGLERRIERQRRNMTDPSQHSNSLVDEKHSIIMKRNSLNDKSNRQDLSLVNENMFDLNKSNANSQMLENNQKLINLCGDSTLTILSTDSGVSAISNSYETNQNNTAEDLMIPKSPNKPIILRAKNVQDNKQPSSAIVISPSQSVLQSYVNNLSSSPITNISPCSNEPAPYSNLSISSSSSSASSSSSKSSKISYENVKKIFNNDFNLENNKIIDENYNDNSIESNYENCKDSKDMYNDDAGEDDDEDNLYDDLSNIYENTPSANYSNKNSSLRAMSYSNDTFDSQSNSVRIQAKRHSEENSQIKLSYLPLNNKPKIISSRNSMHYDFNNNEPIILNNITTKYYDFVENTLGDETSSATKHQTCANELAHKNEIDKYITTQNQNDFKSTPINVRSVISQFQIPQSISLQNNQILSKSTNHQQQQLQEQQQRKPLIKIKSATIGGQNFCNYNFKSKENSHKLSINNNKSNQINVMSSNNDANNKIDFDSSIESAILTKKQSQQNMIDNYNPLMLVKLIHATMDATEV